MAREMRRLWHGFNTKRTHVTWRISGSRILFLSLVSIFISFVVCRSVKSERRQERVHIVLADPRYYSEDGTILTKDVSSYIGKLRRCLDPNMSIWVHCAIRSACVKGIQVEIGELVPSIQVRGSVLQEIIDSSSPFTSWFTRHALNKILLGRDYLDVFRDFIEMAVAYQHGGLVLRPYVTCDCNNMGPRYRGRFCVHSGGEINLISIPKNDAKVKTIVERRLSRYVDDPRLFVPQESRDICLEFNDASTSHWWNNMRKKMSLSCTNHILRNMTGYRRHFGAIWFNKHVLERWAEGASGYNMGDEIQTLASAQWLPFIDVILDRELLDSKYLAKYADRNIIAFLNSWYGNPLMQWPPSRSIKPLMLAMHFQTSIQDKILKSKSYMNEIGPIGARDEATFRFLKDNGINSFTSGCLTMTMQDPGRTLKDPCIFLDVESGIDLYDHVPDKYHKMTCKLSAGWSDSRFERTDWKQRFWNAYHQLEKYSNAKLLITGRLHAILPTLSMGKDAILVLKKNMPGGGGESDNFHRLQIEPLHNFTLDARSQDLNAYFANLDWDSFVQGARKSNVSPFKQSRKTLFTSILMSAPELRFSLCLYNYDRTHDIEC